MVRMFLQIASLMADSMVDFENTQTIVHPAISVWTVAAMPNGDIVSGCSDSVVRVFSTSSERWASAEDLKEYDQLVASQTRPTQEMENMKTSDPSVLNQPGTKPGQTVMVKNAQTGTIEAHQWDAQAYQWQKIGDVVDAVGPGRRQVYEGKEYDYVFDIDVQEGAPALKLPYNVSGM
jgi:phospholipase A-2-activating protein